MRWRRLGCVLAVALLALAPPGARAQQSALELPVQLVGFPFIVLSVRLTNFLKKLSYSVSPATYRARARREAEAAAAAQAPARDEPLDARDVEKHIVAEFGAKACIFERVCAHYAARALHEPRPQLEWPELFRQYKRSPDQEKEFYLLSVFLGDIVGSPALCLQLGKRRSCARADAAT